jgi:hypothetical protein
MAADVCSCWIAYWHGIDSIGGVDEVAVLLLRGGRVLLFESGLYWAIESFFRPMPSRRVSRAGFMFEGKNGGEWCH